MSNSIERETENQIATAMSVGGVTGINIYTSERPSGRILPFACIKASIASEEIAPFTGVFDMSVVISFCARADATSSDNYDSKFQSIVESFYTDPNIASQMTSSSEMLEFYISNISTTLQKTNSAKRTWSRDVNFDIKATTKQ